MWTSQEIIDSIRAAKSNEIPVAPGLDISLDETN
jgi:hypothetical protein